MTEDPRPCTSHTAGTRYKCSSPEYQSDQGTGRTETHLETCELDVHSVKCQLEGVLLDEVCHFAHNIVGRGLVLRSLPKIMLRGFCNAGRFAKKNEFGLVKGLFCLFTFCIIFRSLL